MQRFLPGMILGLLLLGGCAHRAAPASGMAGMPVGPDTLNVADAAIAGGDPEMALSVSQSVLASDPDNPDALVHEGNAFYALGRCPAAEMVYRAAIAHGAREAAQTGLGRCLLKTDPQAAETAFARAVAEAPDDAAALDDLGVARDLQGNFAGAVAPYQRALLADPGDVAAEVNLGLSLALSGNGPAALQYLGPLALGQGATPKIREDYAAALVADGRDGEARQVLSVDLPPSQVASAMNGFAAVISKVQPSLPASRPQAEALPPVAEVQPEVAVVPMAPVRVVATPASPAAPRMAPALPSARAVKAAPARPVAHPVALMAVADPPQAVAIEPAVFRPVPAPTPLRRPAPEPVLPRTIRGGTTVQLAALNSYADAEREWRHLRAAAPAVFSGRAPEIEAATVRGQVFYRLRLDGFDGKAAAERFCGRVRSAGGACTLADF